MKNNIYAQLSDHHARIAVLFRDIGNELSACEALTGRLVVAPVTRPTRTNRRRNRVVRPNGGATTPQMQKIQAYVSSHKGTITPRELIGAKLGNRAQVGRALGEMVQHGILTRSGHGRGVTYSTVAVN